MGKKSQICLSKPRKSRRKMGKLFRHEYLQRQSKTPVEIRSSFTHVDPIQTTPIPSTSMAETPSPRLLDFSVDFTNNEDVDETIVHALNKDDDDIRTENNMGGRRLVNVSFLFEQAMNFQHHNLFSCNSSDVKFIREVRSGFISKFILKCEMCKVEHTVDSDRNDGKLNTNGAAVTGIVNVGGGFSQLNELASSLNMPGISYNLYKKIEDEMNEIFDIECWQSMMEAGKEEAKLARECGQVDENNVPLLTVIADGAWCKRSYRSNYNAKSGAACIVGEKTGKILFLGIRNKYCIMCKKDKDKPHRCFKNWEESSSAMESDIILEGFKLSMEMHNVKYAYLVGDGDSSVHRKILSAKPYGSLVVQKVECSNHLLRNYVTKLKDLALKRFSSKGTEVDIFLRHYLKNNIRRLRLSVDCAIKHRRSQDCEHVEKIKNLKKDIINSVKHVFGDHETCDEYFCKGRKPNEKNLTPLMKSCGLFNDIMSYVNRLTQHSSSLIRNMTNNSAERYNSVLAKFVGGKRVDYSKKGGYEMRCHLAGLSVNSRELFHAVVHKAITKKSPGFHTNKFTQQLVKRREKNRSRKRMYHNFNCSQANDNSSRKKYCDSDDNDDYGVNVHALDIDPEELEKKKTSFLKTLSQTESEISQLSSATVEQSFSNLWFSERRKRLTASSFGKICKMRSTTNPKKVIKAMLHSKFTGNTYTDYGKDHEPIARKEFSDLIGNEVKECGFFIGKNDACFLGASPDGLINDDGLIEIKCPYNARLDTPEDAIIKNKIKFATFESNIFSLKRNDNYFYQVQGQLHITERKYCYFIFWTPKGLLFEKIFRDEIFFKENMQKRLHDFYYNHYLAEILKLQIKDGI